MGVGSITKRINEEGYVKRKNKKWCKSSIRNILTNYNYTGNLILQKTYRENHITKRKKINKGELPKYHAEETHEAIVTIEEYQQVQEELRKRDCVKTERESLRYYPFTSMIVCGKCGKNYRRKTTPYKNVWKCGMYLDYGKDACDAKQVPEEILIEISCEILGLKEFSEAAFKEKVNCIRTYENNILIFKLADKTEVKKQWKNKSRSESWTPEKENLQVLEN